ncbi:MAG: hypothetical protein IJX80_03315, partial [Clostridia bacterium]|nr:hypothetical protein [Clostridia bacterium]
RFQVLPPDYSIAQKSPVVNTFFLGVFHENEILQHFFRVYIMFTKTIRNGNGIYDPTQSAHP